MTFMKYTLAAALWLTSVTIDRQVMQTSNGIEIAWSVTMSQNEVLAAKYSASY